MNYVCSDVQEKVNMWSDRVSMNLNAEVYNGRMSFHSFQLKSQYTCPCDSEAE